jgi:hypothetical protein
LVLTHHTWPSDQSLFFYGTLVGTALWMVIYGPVRGIEAEDVIGGVIAGGLGAALALSGAVTAVVLGAGVIFFGGSMFNPGLP